MNIIDLYKEINSKSTDWDVNLSSTICENDTITITKPDSIYFFKFGQDKLYPDFINGILCAEDGDSIKCIDTPNYDCAGKTVKEVAQDIMSDIQNDMVDRDA